MFLNAVKCHALRRGKEAPRTPYQFTMPVMAWLYTKLQPHVYRPDERLDVPSSDNSVNKTTARYVLYSTDDTPRASPLNPADADAASDAPIRAIGYFSWHNERKLFVTRRVYPTYFDFFSLSFVDEGWGALGELLYHIRKKETNDNVCFVAVDNVRTNHRFLPFLREAHRLDYSKVLVIPFFNGIAAAQRDEATLIGAMAFYLSGKGVLPGLNDELCRNKVAAFSKHFGALVGDHEKAIQTPLSNSNERGVKDSVWEYWTLVPDESHALVYAELTIHNAKTPNPVAMQVQSSLSSGDFVCLREKSNEPGAPLRFWVTCLVAGNGPTEESERVFVDKLKRSIAEAVAIACCGVGQLTMEVTIHVRNRLREA